MTEISIPSTKIIELSTFRTKSIESEINCNAKQKRREGMQGNAVIKTGLSSEIILGIG